MAAAGVGVVAATDAGVAEAAGVGFSSSFARVELFLQPATISDRTRTNGRIRRDIPITTAQIITF